ncbi:MAG TPA: tetratricopeptide repeat protein, partial [Coleofasciculaceae cyanobacterium]
MPTLTPTLRTVSSLDGPVRSTRSGGAMGPGPLAARSLVRSGSHLGWNQELYQRLRLSLGLGLRRQVFLVVCDDLPLRDRLVGRLAQELPAPQLATLRLESHQTEIAGAIAALSAATVQVLGIEQLTRQAARLQRQFLAELETLAQQWATADLSLVLWVPRPWLYTIRESAPQFWACCTGTFEFEGQPTVVVNSPGGGLIDRRVSLSAREPVGSNRPLRALKLAEAHPVDRPQSMPPMPPMQPPSPPAPTELERWVTEATIARARAAEPGLAADIARSTLERAAQAYQRAIEWAQTHDESEALRSLYYELGGVYSDLVRWAEPATAWEQAVMAYRAAIGDGSGGDRAWRVAARNNLGTALWSWARHGEPIARLQEAIAVYRAGLSDYQDPTNPATEAMDGGDRLAPDP